MLYYSRLNFLREETYGDNKVKQGDIAKFIGVSLSTYRKCESENNIFPLKHLVKVCEFYDISLDYVFGFTNEKNYLNNNYEIDRKKTCERIKLIRNRLGLSMKELGKILNCSDSNINDFESGRILISTKKLYNFCNRFNISADYLLGKTDEPKQIQSDNMIKIDWEEKEPVYIYSKRVKELRANAHMEQTEIAKMLGIDRGTYGQYETEYFSFPIKHLNTLCNYFDVSIDYIMGFTNNKKYEGSRKEIDSKLSGERINTLRKSLKLSLDKFSMELESTISTISGYEHGRVIISTSILYLLCEKFNVSADYILGKVDEPRIIEIKDQN